jgi:SAM-dependent methyltransferase
MTQNNNIWEKIHSSRAWGRYPNEELVRFIGRNFFKLEKKERKNLKILELGIGQGANAWFLIREDFDVYGIDISGSAIKKFKVRLKEENLLMDDFDERFKTANIKEVPYNSESFDVIIDIATVWCVSYSDHNLVYNEVKRMLKNGGLFFSWHILKDSWGDDGKNYIDRDTKENPDEGPLTNTGINYFAKYDDLIELLEKYNLNVIEKEFLERTYQNMEKSLKYSITVSKKINQ